MFGLRKFIAWSAISLSATLLAVPVYAADWPSKNITMIVPFGAGGSIDRFARGLAQHWEKQLDGTSIIVENRPGASGLLGAMTFLKAPSDGHTLFVGIQPTLSMNIQVQDAPFKLDDFAIVNVEQRDFGDVVVGADSPFESIQQFVNEARAKPGKLSVAMIHGGGTSLFGLALLEELDLDVRVVTFDSGGALRTNMLGNHSDVTISGAYGDVSLADKVRVLAVASAEPFPGLPNAIPVSKAFKDIKVPQIGDSRFLAVHSQFAREQPEQYAKLVDSYRKTFESADYQAYLKKTGTDVISQYVGPEVAQQQSEEMDAVVGRFKDVLKNK
ncbi:tripartite tricarboxylate transporter substrate binding protein [Alcaligenaceae bacterium]|nr:tripartite tricarboxylate transporter substrate binding protein [Alcaligenaceae bacterium]